MPKAPMFTLAWSSATQGYELYQTRERDALGIVPGSSNWFTWLEQVSSFAFVGKSGHYTARKEVKQRGGRYWYAYQATNERLIKKYLGKTSHLTLTRLEDTAGLLDAQSAARTSPPVTRAGDTNDEVDNIRSSVLAQRPHPLHPLLPTKLHVPRPRTHLVSRAHLLERLQQGMARQLTLVSAPAGFGKTTLLAQWLMESKIPVAWLSLEGEDNDPTRFLSYLIAALQTLDAQLGTSALALLRTPQPAPPETVLAVLTNDLVAHDTDDITLVLDDYHVITADPIHRGMTFLLEHLPPGLHLVLATRADPPLPLARLRAQGQLTEVRAADLRFGTAEASTFLLNVMRLDLPPEAITTLEQRTEGWIAGLQLAALSLQEQPDPSAFLAAFTGSHRYVLDYLSDEVLARQPEAVQQFLLHTSLLERLSGPLCDAVTEREGSHTTLEALERANLFVVALDDERHWYRYHHLFAEMLRRHLQQREPTLQPILHRRASAWYEQHELLAEAVQHALTIPDAELAARLIEPMAQPIMQQGQASTVLSWMNALPDALIRARPFLCISYASLLTVTNQLEAAEARLQQAKQGIQAEMPAEQVQLILGYMLTIRGRIAYYAGDLPPAISLARQALEMLPETDGIFRAAALATTIRAYLMSGDVTAATEHEVATAIAFARASDNLFSTVGSITLLARLHILQGKLRQAATTYAQVVQAVPRSEVLHAFLTSISYYFGLGDLLREWNDLEAAEQNLAQGMALINETLTVEPFVVMLGYTAQARLEQACGNSDEVLATLEALTRLADRRHFASNMVAQGEAVRAQLELAQGNLAAAIRWADASGLSALDDDLPYPREGEYLALARVRIAQARRDPAAPFLQDVLHLLDRLQESAEVRARTGSVLEILIVRALALEAQGNRTSALSTLESALVLAEPEGYVRLFVDEGAPMLDLLRQTHTRSRVPGYVGTLLSAFGEQHVSVVPRSSPHPDVLAEPLTEREREVLRMLLTGASNREIAHRLVVSVNTIKRHIYNLCGKLGVKSRTQAIARARSFNLL